MHNAYPKQKSCKKTWIVNASWLYCGVMSWQMNLLQVTVHKWSCFTTIKMCLRLVTLSQAHSLCVWFHLKFIATLVRSWHHSCFVLFDALKAHTYWNIAIQCCLELTITWMTQDLKWMSRQMNLLKLEILHKKELLYDVQKVSEIGYIITGSLTVCMLS